MSANPKDLQAARTSSPSNMAASYWLEGINELGVDYLFCNLGTDHAPIIETMAQWQAEGRRYPKVILAPHENVAMHMAMGYTRMTGKAQVVLVHVDAGTANAAMAMHNAFRSRLPLILMAGTAPVTVRGEMLGTRDTYVHFVQDPYDMRGIVRNYVKWEYQLPTGVVVKEALRRAHTMTMSDPQGPVYMTLPREILAETLAPEHVASFPEDRYGPVRLGGGDEAAVAEVARRLLAAENPLLITSYAGRNPQTPALLDELAQLAGIGVIESYPQILNISKESPCFLGNIADDKIGDVDFGILLDTDLPWMPRDAQENPDTFWAHIDVDPVKADIPIWGFPTSLRIPADSALFLRRLIAVLREQMTDEHRKRVAGRLEKFAQLRQEAVAFIARHGERPGEVGAINPGYLCKALNKVLGQDDILVSESVMNEPSVAMHMNRTQANTFLGLGGGGLGFGGGAALGAKLARRDKLVMHLTGDGSFYFSNPSAVYSVAAEHDLPIFTVVFENGGWSAVKQCTAKVHPDGVSRDTDEYQARLNPNYQFQKVCEAAGGYGEEVADPADLDGAIDRCLAAVRDGRPACLVAHVERL